MESHPPAVAQPRHESVWQQHVRGHLLRFDPRPWPALGAGAGARLLLVAAGIEVLRIAALAAVHPRIPLLVIVPILLGATLVAVPMLAATSFAELGFRPWREWTVTERSYFVQVLALVSMIFGLVPASAPAGDARALWAVFVPYLCFGFYQELVYRGMVQRALVARWGAGAGILIANALYTFGPLHWEYFAAPGSRGVPMFAAIFAVGLFFGVLYRRSGNLWLVACFHAIGNAMIVWRAGTPA